METRTPAPPPDDEVRERAFARLEDQPSRRWRHWDTVWGATFVWTALTAIAAALAALVGLVVLALYYGAWRGSGFR